jgi:pyruvate, water dikinase
MYNMKFKLIEFKQIALAGLMLATNLAFAQARIMNPGEAIGQFVLISSDDVINETDKYKSLNPLSIPVFAELPLDLSVIAGAITLKQQNELSHVQLKSRARKTPNLDISALSGGVENELFSGIKEGDWIRLSLSGETITIEPSTQEAAEEFYQNRKTVNVELKFDLDFKKILPTSELRSTDFIRVGSKAANYGELAYALNSTDRIVVREGFSVPFAYYHEFVESNPKVKQAIQDVLDDPIMDELIDVQYRANVLEELRDTFQDPENVVNQELIQTLLSLYEEQRYPSGKLRNMKMRSSTNSEDLPNFNGAGLYTSGSYKPYKKKKEKSAKQKEETVKEVLQLVWSSVWELRAFDERNYFSIPHNQVKMGMQINPSFSNEDADGVVVTKYKLDKSANSKDKYGVYIEVQRGGEHSVANPTPGVKPQQIFVKFDETAPLNKELYQITVLQNSNIADDNITVLPDADNPIPVMSNDEIIDLAYLSLKAELHFKPILGEDDPNFSLDIEFKIDSEDEGARRVYLKQSRPYIQ